MNSGSCLLKFAGGRFRLCKAGGLWTEFDRSALGSGVNVSRDFPSVFLIIVRQYIGIRHADSLQAKHSCHLLLVNKVRITELLEPIEVIEDGMVNAVGACRADITGGHA